MINGHRESELKSIALHQAVVKKFKENPDLIKKAVNKLSSWIAQKRIQQRYIEGWQNILSRRFEEILEIIVEDNENMRDLRQNTPFCGILSPKERWEVLRKWKGMN